jgi:tRNA pseudouridine65 synthase
MKQPFGVNKADKKIAQLKILYQDDSIVAIAKPAGFFVHPLEDENFWIPSRFNCLKILRNQIGKWVYPVHRLDRATSGIVLFALNPNTAAALSKQFIEHKIKKTYILMCRGYVSENGSIERELDNKHSKTIYERLKTIELPYQTQEKFLTSRYSLCLAYPITGRHHQIRRHFNGISHPLIGDTTYGDKIHNQLFKDTLKINGLLLRAIEIEFTHPETQKKICIQYKKWGDTWQRVFNLFGICYNFTSASSIKL